MNSDSRDIFIDIGKCQIPKKSMRVCGDHMISTKLEGGNRVISILSDGLGSGIKASVLSTLCSSMFMQFASNDIDIEHSARMIMEILPICQIRKIAYSTFTIVDINLYGQGQIIEFDNPPACVIRNGEFVRLEKRVIPIQLSNGRKSKILHSRFEVKEGDRVVCFSDGVSQSGIGKKFPLGWREEDYQRFMASLISHDREISAKKLAHHIVSEALSNDRQSPHDDISCGVIYLRKPRKTLVLTGPPMKPEHDHEFAEMAQRFSGKKIICGGTTASIISRELDKEITINTNEIIRSLPPTSNIEGFDLVCEGILTLNKTLDYLNNTDACEETKLAEHLLASDDIRFVVGTKINDAHYSPQVSCEFEIRRTIVKKIAEMLKDSYFKKTTITYI